MWRPSVAQFLKCFSHSFTRNKENPKSPDVLAKHKAQIPKEGSKDRPEFKAKPKDEEGARGDKPGGKEAKADYKKNPRLKGPAKLSGRKVKYNFGKNKNNSIMKTALIIGSWINRFSIIEILLERRL
jgi:hypothetical protein